jgi:hypothetical protein
MLAGYTPASKTLITPVVNVKGYGAVGNGVTDDIIAIRAAVTAAALATNSILYFPSSMGYAITDTLTVPTGISIVMDAPLIYTGAGEEAALIVGSAGAVNALVHLKLRVRRATQSTWLNEDNIGIKLFNLNAAYVQIVEASNFTIGVQCIGSAHGFAYNQTVLAYIVNNKYGVDLTNETAGWCCENLYEGGRFSCESGIGVGLSRYGVRITSKDLTYLTNNNNVFQKPSFELSKAMAGAADAICVKIEYGHQNQFKDFRNEGNSTVCVEVQNASTENVFEAAYSFFTIANVSDTSSCPATSVRDARRKLLDPAHLVFDSGPLPKVACYADGATNVHIPRVHRTDNGGGARSYMGLVASLDSDYVEIDTRGVAIFINTTLQKRFVVRCDCVSSATGGRVFVKCYDSTGVVLTSADVGHPYVTPLYGATFAYTANMGGAYATGSDSNLDTFFAVGPDVAKVEVILGKGTATLKLRSFKIYSVDGGDCMAWPDYEQVVPGANIGTVAPTAGTWVAGRVVFNNAPAVGKPIGWVCVTGGTPGTWASLAGEVDTPNMLSFSFFYDVVAANLTNTDMLTAIGDAVCEFIMNYAGSILAVGVVSDQARTAGTLTVEVTKNGTGVGLTAVLNGTNTTKKVTTQTKDTDTFVAADLMGVHLTTSADWAPATADIRVVITVEM